MALSLYVKPKPDSATAKHSPKYKDFLFGGTVTLYVGRYEDRMEIHKKLLAGLSPELNKHVYNNMREGTEGTIRFPDEEVETVTHFTEWAYTGEYALDGDTPPANTRSHTAPKRVPWLNLYRHLQIYAFSDKFNIPILKQLAESKFHSEINPLYPDGSKDVAGLVKLISYAYDNLPGSDPILKFLTQYASWMLELLRPSKRFNKLMLARPEFLKDLLMNLKGPSTKPTARALQIHPMIYGREERHVSYYPSVPVRAKP
ncbi:hypothetical protein C7212DRAFT_365581 [Tuber magnatum]|uniref:BTB domain-containing protein n=1 Tax=Tuber magnatum TaxID=42249 RepID=A0A317SGV5_9PEZI|nr:hypothetical protein C7212DRAFT_365581 [Tuber magnatum]